MGKPGVDGRSDIYSLGCVTFEMLAGRRAFDGTTLRQIAEQQQNHIPPRLDRERPEVPPAVAAAVARALEKDPALRFQAAGDFATALGPVPAPIPGPSRAAARPLTGIMLLAAAVLAVAILILSILYGS